MTTRYRTEFVDGMTDLRWLVAHEWLAHDVAAAKARVSHGFNRLERELLRRQTWPWLCGDGTWVLEL